MEMIFDSKAYKKYFAKVIMYWFMFGARYPLSKYFAIIKSNMPQPMQFILV